jgi:hypothetical protein
MAETPAAHEILLNPHKRVDFECSLPSRRLDLCTLPWKMDYSGFSGRKSDSRLSFF